MTINTPSKRRFNGATFLITGAGFDIGKALAIRCAQKGAHVILMDNNNRALNAVYDEIMSGGGAEPTILKIKSEAFKEDAAALVREQIMSDHGKLDGLIHTQNASFPLTPVNLVEDEQLSVAVRMLCGLPHQITRELYPVLEASDEPSVIFTSHFSAHTHKPFWSYHSTAFAALEALSRQWAADTKNVGFSVNSIDPGKVNTAIRRKHYPAENPAALLSPDDEQVLNLYLNLLSGLGKKRTGEHFVLSDY